VNGVRPVRASHSREVTRTARAARVDAASGPLPGRLGWHPERLSPQWVLALHGYAGNSAVRELLHPIQRDPLSWDDDPHGYTGTAGIKNVRKSGTTRREVHGLKFGVKGGFAGSYTSKTYPKGLDSEEGKMTKETPDNMAVVIMPDKLDKRPVQVILHFAGWGFRDIDPFAGYTVARGGKRGKRTIDKGSVRDVDQEHWEQQIGAINQERTNGPQTIAILAQGRGMSDFGDVPTFDYIQDVLAHVSELNSVKQYSLILTAHSGGGGTQISPKVKSGQAQTRDRSKLPSAKEGKAAPQPTDMVVLFDSEGTSGVTGWAVSQIDALAKSIKAAAAPADAQAAIAATPKFRGYFAVGGAYDSAFNSMHKKLCEAILKVPAPWALPDAADPKRVTVADLFRIVPVSGKSIDHEHVISGGNADADADAAKQGSVADALRAEADPTVDRASGLPCEAPKAPKSKRKSKSKPAKR
jgi:hypothetical protein